MRKKSVPFLLLSNILLEIFSFRCVSHESYGYHQYLVTTYYCRSTEKWIMLIMTNRNWKFASLLLCLPNISVTCNNNWTGKSNTILLWYYCYSKKQWRQFEQNLFNDGLENGILRFTLVNYACYVFPLCSTYVIVR